MGGGLWDQKTYVHQYLQITSAKESIYLIMLGFACLREHV